MGYKIIETIDQLKSECLKKKDDYGDFFIVLAGGLARSSKRIRYDQKNNRFDVHNEIDDSFQDDLSEEDLRNQTMIVEAIEKSAFFQLEI
jgi:hypothetical protein